jgi:hypothetical protein
VVAAPSSRLPPRPPSPPARHWPAPAPIVGVVLAALLAAGCLAGPSAPPTTPTGTPGGAPVGGAPTAGPASLRPSPSLPSQTDTPWGRIWDALPASFPLPAGAVPTQTGAGPDSGEWQVDTPPAGTTDDLAAALGRAGYRVDRSGPYEDGSFVLEATAGDACRARVTIAPLGQSSGLTLVTVLFGAGCPFR